MSTLKFEIITMCKKLKYILIPVVCMGFISIFLIFSNRKYDANFKKVATLKNKVFVLATTDPSVTAVSMDMTEKYVTMNKLFRKSVSLESIDTPFVVNPDGTFFAVGVDSTLIIYNTTQHKAKTINLKKLGYEGYRIFTPLSIGKNKIWIALHNMREKDIIVECNYKKQNTKHKKLELNYCESPNIAYFNEDTNPEKYGLKPGNLIHSLGLYFGPGLEPKVIPTKLLTSGPFPRNHMTDYNFCDYLPDKGWLFSVADHVNIPINTKYDLDVIIHIGKDGIPKKLTSGIHAVWGSDGYVYYTDLNDSLCRINPKEKKEEVVIKSFASPPAPANRFGRSNLIPMYSNRRNFLLFLIKKDKDDPECPVIIDLKNKEYRVLASKKHMNIWRLGLYELEGNGASTSKGPTGSDLNGTYLRQ